MGEHSERAPMPHGVGIGWRPQIGGLLAAQTGLGWVEVVAESIMDGLPAALRELRKRGVTVVPHGVGLGLGDADGLDRRRVERFAATAPSTGAPLVSEHIAFVRSGGVEVDHLTPLPRTRAAIDVMVRNVKTLQQELDVPLALECVAALFTYPEDELSEAQFVTEIIERTDALLLLDVANVYANAHNHGGDPLATVRSMPLERLAYVHVAGGIEHDGTYHDTHTAAVNPQVLQLLSALAEDTRIPAAMLERDGDYPSDAELLSELDAIADAAAMPHVTTTFHPASDSTHDV